MQARTPTPRTPIVFAAVLAAGRSRRFGRSKLLEAVDGQPLVRRAASIARAVCGDRSILVTGHDSTAVTAAAGHAAQFLIVNDRHEEGIGGSIALAARAVAHTADALLILFADQPLITVQHAEALTGAWSGAQDEIVATGFAGTVGPPVLFPRGAFDALGALSGDTGAKRILEDAAFSVRTVPFEDAAIDIDTPADLEKLRN
jgi:molybdenum cofactor cytidylyltransferase